jgi:hypothetical protein
MHEDSCLQHSKNGQGAAALLTGPGDSSAGISKQENEEHADAKESDVQSRRPESIRARLAWVYQGIGRPKCLLNDNSLFTSMKWRL